MKRREFGLLVLGMCSLGLIVGCGEANPLGRKAVSGKVTLDGSPVKYGSINFSPMQQGGTSSGAVIKDGSYSIEEVKGLPPGKYRVEVHASDSDPASATMPAGAMPGDEEVKPAKELIPESWNKEAHTIEVTAAGPNEFNFDISTKGK